MSDRQLATTASSACIHCGSLFFGESSEKFCCAGCEFVFGLIHTEGLDGFYDIKKANPPACPLPLASFDAGLSYAYLDSIEVRERLSPDNRHLRFYLEGLNCTACLWLLEKLPQFCDSAEAARVNLAESTIDVTKKENGSFAAIAETLNRFGYRPRPLSESDGAGDFAQREMRRDLIRIGIAAAASGNIMILAVSLYGGATGVLALQFRWLSAALALPVLTFCAWPFYRSALAGVRSKVLNLDVPIVAALIAGIATSAWTLLFNSASEAVYFDSLSMLVFLLLSSRFFLKSLQRRQLSAAHLEDELLFSTASRITPDGSLVRVSASELRQGDVLLATADSALQIDGRVSEGSALIDAAVLTGEADPVSIGPGSKVEAGCRVISGEVKIVVEAIPRDTRLAQILRDTERAVRSRPKVVQLSNKVSQWFIALTFLAAMGLCLSFLSTEPAEGISRALALIIVTCPCVFGIAIPLSMSFAVRSAAASGIIIKDAEAIEKLWNIRRLFFDKTGTLTTGAMSVSSVECKDPRDLAIALALEKNQPHPAAKAITSYLEHQRTPVVHFAPVEMLRTGGVAGSLDGVRYRLQPVETTQITADERSQRNGIRLSFGLFKNDEQVATFSLGDSLRPDALETLSWARDRKLEVDLISGDRTSVVNAVAKGLGIPRDRTHSEFTPEMKADALSRSQRSLMIGDGVNDAAALAAAEVGIALSGSLDVSLRAADIYLTRPQLSLVPKLFEIAHSAKTTIFRNLVLSAGFNVVSGTLAATGHMTPLFAAVLMPMSSLTVLLSATWTQKR